MIPYFTMEKMGQIPEHHWLKWPIMPLYSLQSRWRKVCKHSSCHTGFPRCFDISLLKRDKVPTDCYPLKYVNVRFLFFSRLLIFFFCSEVLLVEVKSGLARIHVWVFGTFLLQDFPQSFRAAQESSHNGPKTHRKTKQSCFIIQTFIPLIYFTAMKTCSFSDSTCCYNQ